MTVILTSEWLIVFFFYIYNFISPIQFSESIFQYHHDIYCMWTRAEHIARRDDEPLFKIYDGVVSRGENKPEMTSTMEME